MLHRDQMVGRELGDDPVAVKATDAAVLLTPEHDVRAVVDGNIIDVSHARLDLERKTQAPSLIAGEDRTGQAELRLVGQP